MKTFLGSGRDHRQSRTALQQNILDTLYPHFGHPLYRTNKIISRTKAQRHKEILFVVFNSHSEELENH